MLHYQPCEEYILLQRDDGFCLQRQAPAEDWEQADGFLFCVKEDDLCVVLLQGEERVGAFFVPLSDQKHVNWLSNTPLLRVECMRENKDDSYAFVAASAAMIEGMMEKM